MMRHGYSRQGFDGDGSPEDLMTNNQNVKCSPGTFSLKLCNAIAGLGDIWSTPNSYGSHDPVKHMSEETGSADNDPPSVDRLSRLWQRINDHKVAQWSIGYVALAYTVQHAVVLTNEAFEWPHEMERVSMLLLALGLPLVMTFSWYHGAKANRHFSNAEMTIISILLVIGALVFYIFFQPTEQITLRHSASAQAVTSVEPAVKTTGISIAVLPFTNLSPDPDQGFFSDGMTEEITAALTQVKGLRVIGRTSAFVFKGKNEDLRVIGQKLGATNLIEGSVRKEGNQLRITVQLIRADDDSHLWAQSYDRELKDVFAVQEDIARTIAASLQVPLNLKQGETLVSDRTIDPESYQDYLRAKVLIRSRQPVVTTMDAPIALLESIVARQPKYAPAWALLSQAYDLAPGFNPVYFFSGSVADLRRLVDADLPKAMAAARQAIALDPRNADAYVGLARAQALIGKWLDAEESFKQALTLDPLNPEGLNFYNAFLYSTGRAQEAVTTADQLKRVEPLVSQHDIVIINACLAAGDYAKALAVAQHVPNAHGFLLAQIYAAMGRYKEAASEIETNLNQNQQAEMAAKLIGAAPAPAPQSIPYLQNFSFVFAYVGRPERVFEWAEHNADAGYFAGQFNWFWQPNFGAARKTDLFKALVRKLGLIEYWRVRGWPELCRPIGSDDFVCH
jgi:TolB-like protein